MMKSLIFFFTFSIIFLSSFFYTKADWEPFPLGQTSFFTIKDYLLNLNHTLNKPLTDYILTYSFDSLQISGDGAQTYFASRLRDYNIFGYCDSAIISKATLGIDNTPFRFDSISLRNDTLFYIDKFINPNTGKPNLLPFYIPLHMKEFDLIEEEAFFLKDKGINYEQILPGLYDSVKTYGIKQKNGDQKIVDFKISKNYGIILFYPFKYILSNRFDFKISHKLSGLSNKEVKFGITPELFDWDDFFTLKPDDEKYWRSDENHFPFYNYYEKEKIVKIKKDDDSLVITKEITNYSLQSEKYDYYLSDEVYYHSELNRFKEKNDQELYSTNKGVGNTPDWKLIRRGGGLLFLNLSFLNFEKASTILKCDGLLFDIKCKYGFYEPTYSIILSPHIGFSYYAGDGTFRELVGYTQDGVLSGECPQPLSINESVIQNNISVFPNPATDRIQISNLPDGELFYEVMNYYGEKVLSGILNNQIDIMALQTGIYFIKLGNQPPIKFIKI